MTLTRRNIGRGGFALAVGLLIAVTAIKYFAKAQTPSRLGELTRTAFLRWRPQVLALDNGTDIYQAFAYPNPPIMALILKPFMHLPPLVGAMTWFTLKVFLAGLILVWALRLLGQSKMPEWAKCVAIALSLHPILGDLAHGNVNLFIGFLVIAMLELFRRRRDTLAGITLALAIACKVTPALFVPYFLWKRAWRALAGTMLGLVVWLAVVPGVALGHHTNLTLLSSWFEQMVKPFLIDGKVTTEHPNQSLPGLTYRLLCAEPSFLEYDDEDGRPVAADFHNIAALPPSTVKLITQGCMAFFALAVVALCRWPTHRAEVPRAGPAFAAECGFVLMGMLLFSERTWKHHAVTLIVPMAVLLWAVSVPGACSVRGRWLMRAFLGGVVLLLWGPALMGPESQDVALVYGAYTAAYLALAGAMLLVLWRVRKMHNLPDGAVPQWAVLSGNAACSRLTIWPFASRI